MGLNLESYVDLHVGHALAGSVVQESVAIRSCACRDLGERIRKRGEVGRGGSRG